MKSKCIKSSLSAPLDSTGEDVCFSSTNRSVKCIQPPQAKMRPSTISLASIAMLGGFDIAHAVCTGSNLAIGTPAVLGTGNTQCKTPVPCANSTLPECAPLRMLVLFVAFSPLVGSSQQSPPLTLFSDNVYDGSCKTTQSLQINTAIGPCISEYFLCALGTKNIEGYDDPTTGISYNCQADTTSESCGSDVVSLCVSAS